MLKFAILLFLIVSDALRCDDNVGERPLSVCPPVEIDVVYTWVNGSDPELVDSLDHWKQVELGIEPHRTNRSDSRSGAHRFRDQEELRYSLRSVMEFAPWVRKIFIVTNGQVPSWLDTSHPRIRVVSHREIFSNSSWLPTFSSPSIESQLHHIPGLSQHFLYLNDDVMFSSPVFPADFLVESPRALESWALSDFDRQFSESQLVSHRSQLRALNLTKSLPRFDLNLTVEPFHTIEREQNLLARPAREFLSTQAPSWYNYKYQVYLAYTIQSCRSTCLDHWLGDGNCDDACNNPECGYDDGDCIGQAPQPRTQLTETDKKSINERYCSSSCPHTSVMQVHLFFFPLTFLVFFPRWVGDRVCDRSCKTLYCGYDGGDCLDDDTLALQRQLPQMTLHPQLCHSKQCLTPSATEIVIDKDLAEASIPVEIFPFGADTIEKIAHSIHPELHCHQRIFDVGVPRARAL